MPVYRYRCNKCIDTWENFRNISDRKEEVCGRCGDQAEIVITSIAKPVIYDYYSESLGAYVTGPKQKRDIMRIKNLEET